MGRRTLDSDAVAGAVAIDVEVVHDQTRAGCELDRDVRQTAELDSCVTGWIALCEAVIALREVEGIA